MPEILRPRVAHGVLRHVAPAAVPNVQLRFATVMVNGERREREETGVGKAGTPWS